MKKLVIVKDGRVVDRKKSLSARYRFTHLISNNFHCIKLHVPSPFILTAIPSTVVVSQKVADLFGTVSSCEELYATQRSVTWMLKVQPRHNVSEQLKSKLYGTLRYFCGSTESV